MLAIKRSAGIVPELNLRECVTCMPPPSVNKATFQVLKPRGDIIKSKTGLSVAPQKGLMSSKIFFFKKKVELVFFYKLTAELTFDTGSNTFWRQTLYSYSISKVETIN